MKRVDAILRHPLFEEKLRLLDELEAERAFCRHDLTHLMDVARLMWIDVLERRLAIDRDVVYAAALLHDLGRAEQMQHGIPHEQASAALGVPIYPVDADGFALCDAMFGILPEVHLPDRGSGSTGGAEYYKYNPHKEG